MEARLGLGGEIRGADMRPRGLALQNFLANGMVVVEQPSLRLPEEPQ